MSGKIPVQLATTTRRVHAIPGPRPAVVFLKGGVWRCLIVWCVVLQAAPGLVIEVELAGRFRASLGYRRQEPGPVVAAFVAHVDVFLDHGGRWVACRCCRGCPIGGRWLLEQKPFPHGKKGSEEIVKLGFSTLFDS